MRVVESDDVMLKELINQIIQPLAPPTTNINPISNEHYGRLLFVVKIQTIDTDIKLIVKEDVYTQ